MQAVRTPDSPKIRDGTPTYGENTPILCTIDEQKLTFETYNKARYRICIS